jgi:hypothetical protein
MGNPLQVEVDNWENHETKSPLPRLITRGGRQKIGVSSKIGGLPKKPTTYLIPNCQYKIRYRSMEYEYIYIHILYIYMYIYICNIKSTSVHISSKKGMINFRLGNPPVLEPILAARIFVLRQQEHRCKRYKARLRRSPRQAMQRIQHAAEQKTTEISIR